jgi:hypothetical protein
LISVKLQATVSWVKIRNFVHKGLKRLYAEDSAKGVPPDTNSTPCARGSRHNQILEAIFARSEMFLNSVERCCVLPYLLRLGTSPLLLILRGKLKPAPRGLLFK